MTTFELEPKPFKGLALHMELATIEDTSTGYKAEITTTIGCGGMSLIMRLETEGGIQRREIMDLKPLIMKWVADGIAAEIEGEVARDGA